MLLEILKDYGELISITLIPFIIWGLGAYFQDRKSKQDAKLQLFLKLMANRKATPNKEWTDALNLIDIVFQDNTKVRKAWRAYFDSLNGQSPHFNNSNSFLLDLLSEIAETLGYKHLKQTEIDRFYSPRIFGNIEINQDILVKEQIRVLLRSKAYGVEMSESEFQENLQKVYNTPPAPQE